MVKTPQQIKNEVKKGCGKPLDKDYETKCGENWNEKDILFLCKECKAKLSILTEYDKAMKEMILKLKQFVNGRNGEDCNGESKECICDICQIARKINSILSKIGDNSEVKE